jgi:hypothetical protein
MGGVKRMMEEEEGKHGVAMHIALEANVLEQCEFHDDCIYAGSEEIESAYKLGNYKLSHGEFDGVFEDRREMTDIIKEVVEDHQGDECFACAKNRDE